MKGKQNSLTMKLLTLFYIGFCLFKVALSIPTCSQIQSMASAIRNSAQNTDGFPALYLRLGFHDCVGGCNGCINFNNPDNNGLKNASTTLTNIYIANNYSSYGVSLADFWALAATVGVSLSVFASNSYRDPTLACTPKSCNGICPYPCFALQWGRVDAKDCSNEPALPSPTMTGDAMFSYFQSGFGFSRAQVVALMGAHSLGGALQVNSGYQGKWTGLQNVGFSEQFYTNFLNATTKWTNTNVANKTSSTPKWQFNGVLDNGSKAGFMLNTDVELFYNLTLDSTTAQATCKLNSTCGLTNSCGSNCVMATTFSQAYSYSKNCTLFMNNFVSVLQLMLANGYSSTDLQTSTSNSCCTP